MIHEFPNSASNMPNWVAIAKAMNRSMAQKTIEAIVHIQTSVSPTHLHLERLVSAIFWPTGDGPGLNCIKA
jgi:hypothetical protein